MSRVRSAVLRHEGEMRFSAETGTGRTIVFGDEVDANEQSPVEMVTTAIAACSAMDVVSIALKQRQALVRYEIRVDAEQRDEYPQILTRVDVVHEVEGPSVDPAAIRRCVELSAAKYCPVNAMISAGATVVHHRMRILRPGEAPIEEEVMVTGPDRRPDIIA
jgi:putative redox protein